MHNRVWSSALLAAWLAFWCGCGGQQANAPDQGDPPSTAGNGGDPASGTKAGGAVSAGGANAGGAKTGSATPRPAADAGYGKLDTSFISDDFAAAAVLHPRHAMQSKPVALIAALPGPLTRDLTREFPLDPESQNRRIAESVEQVIGLLAPADGELPVALAGIIRFTDAKAAEILTADMKARGEKRTHEGKTYYFSSGATHELDRIEVPSAEAAEKLAELNEVYAAGGGFKPDITSTKSKDGKTTTIVVSNKITSPPGMPNAAFLPDEKTMVMATEPLLKKMMVAKDVKSPLLDRLSVVGVKHDLVVVAQVDRLRPAAKFGTQAVRAGVPLLLQPVLSWPETTKAATITAGLDADPLLTIELEANDEAAAKQIEEQATGLLLMGQGAYGNIVKTAMQKQPDFKPLLDYGDAFVSGVAVERDGAKVVATAPGLKDLDQLPEKLKPLLKLANKAERMNQLRQIGLGLQNHHDQMGEFPVNLATDEGKPLLSWRVAVLPFIEHQNLWQEFDRTQPWDSERNKPLLQQMPKELERIEGGTKPGHTVYLMFQGPGTPLDGKPKSLSMIRDGTSNTIAIIEVSPEKAVPWTQPVDIDFTAADLKQAIGPPPIKEGWPAVFFDGHAQIIPAAADMDTFKRLIRIDDGRR